MLRSYTYMQGSTGMVIEFDSVGNLSDNGGTESFSIYPSSISWPNGEFLGFTYTKVAVGGGTRHRPNRISSNLGYEMQLTYQSSNVNVSGWFTLAQATIYRSADTSTALASHTYGTGTPGTITDLAGRVWSCCADMLDSPVQVSAITQRLPGETTDSFVATAASGATAP